MRSLAAAALVVAACGSTLQGGPDAFDAVAGFEVVVEVPALPCAPAGVDPITSGFSVEVADFQTGQNAAPLSERDALVTRTEADPRRYVAVWAWQPGVTSEYQIGVTWYGEFDAGFGATAAAQVPATATGHQTITATAHCQGPVDAAP
jgi:hypothetical protein